MQTSPSNMMPNVSVIIPSYKTAHLIPDCLESVFAQTYKDFEVMVVNDGSPDTPELEQALKPYAGRIVYIKQENKRAAGARNTAIQQASGEFLAFLDSDDTWTPDHLAGQMQLFAQYPTLDLVYSNALLVGDPERECEFMEQCPSHGQATFDALVVERCQIPISTVVARKRAIVKAGMFDEKLLRCDDYDMWVRTAFHGANIAYSRKVQARMAIGRPGSLSQERSKMVEAYWRILEKFQRTLPLSDADRDVVARRAAVIRVRYLVAEGKCRLDEHKFDKARELFVEAQRSRMAPRLSLVLLGLRIAPNATSKLVSLWSRFFSGSVLSRFGGAST